MVLPPSPRTSNLVVRLPELEALRGLLSLWVIVVHSVLAVGLEAKNWFGPLKLFGEGDDAVYIFIMLSGFVIFNLLDNTTESYAVYLARRFLRLFPAYFVCLLLASMTLGMAVDSLSNMPWHPPFALVRLRLIEEAQQNYMPHFLSHITMLHGVIPGSMLADAPYTILGQGWSISLEWQFYIVAPLILFLMRRYGGLTAFLLILIVFTLRRMSSDNPALLVTQFEYFGFGAISYYGWKYISTNVDIKMGESFYKCGLLLVLFIANFSRSPSLAIWFFTLLALCAARWGVGSRVEMYILLLLRHRLIRYLGKISYSVYLIHMISIYVCMYFLIIYVHGLTQWQFLTLLLTLVIISSVGVAAFLYSFVERPFINFGRRLFSRNAIYSKQ